MTFEDFENWFAEKIVLRGLVIVMAVSLGIGVCFGIVFSLKHFGVIQKKPDEIYINLYPYYWTCNEAHIQHYRGGNVKIGYYDYSHCECTKWEAHMRGREYPPDALCFDGRKPIELNGVR